MVSQSWTHDSFRCRILVLSIAFSVWCWMTIALTSRWINTSSDYSDATARGSRAVETLKFVIVVSRHGNRGPLAHIPNDPYPINNTKFWPYGGGGLTPHGRIQMFNLGAKIRSLYNGFLDSRYDTNDFYASSTAIDRSLLSAEAFLAGLYPPTEKQPWEQKFPSQLIPLYSNSLDKTLEAEFCRKVLSIRNTTLTKFGEEHAEVISGLNQYLNQYSGTNVSGIAGFFATWDTIICEATEGFELPTWMQQIFPHPILDLASDYYVQFVAGSTNLVSIIMGDFYQELIGVLKNKVEGKLSPDRKMVFYSGHDFTLITLQAILGIPTSSIIGVARPGSAMIFELHQRPDSEEFFIQVLYVDGSSKDLTPWNLPIPNCNPSCEFYQIVNTTKIFASSKSFDEECLPLIK